MNAAETRGKLSDLSYTLQLHIRLRSDTTFGRGAGMISTVGVVDREIDHDSDGLPRLRGRALKGLLNESASEILYSVGKIFGKDSPQVTRWQQAAARLFGGPGSDLYSQGWVDYHDAMLPAPLRAAIQYELHERRAGEARLQPSQLLNALTTIRRQTAMNEWGVPVAASLRAQRVLLRETPLVAELSYLARLHHEDEAATKGMVADDFALLAAAIMGWERGGSTRNRGLGWLTARLHDDADVDITAQYFTHFAAAIEKQGPA